MTHLRVVTFARYAELLGSEAVEVALPNPATVASLIEAIRALPGGEQLPPHPLIAINHAIASPEAPVAPGDAVALLPPLAGG